jgi:hypothetical protein
MSLTLKDVEAVMASGKLLESDMRVLDAQLVKLEKLKERELCQEKFIKFTEKVWPTFISGAHHKRMAEAFERVAKGECKRLIINMPPRHTKSEFASYLLPAWFLGKFPHKKVIQSSNTGELAVGFGRKVRNLVDSEVYNELFPNLALQADSKAAGRWNTSKGGDYFAIGVGGTVTGKGADLLIIDDPHSEQEAAMAASNPDIYDKVFEWYTSGPRQRLQPGGSIIIVMTRWAQRDLTGQVLKSAAQRTGEDWEVIEFPAILPSGNPLWPQFWSIGSLKRCAKNCPTPSGKLSISRTLWVTSLRSLSAIGGNGGRKMIRLCASSFSSLGTRRSKRHSGLTILRVRRGAYSRARRTTSRPTSSY